MKKRILTVALVVALLATCFAGTYAYLKDSEAQVNTFTVGEVYITLDEAAVEQDVASGNWVDSGKARVVATKDTTPTGNAYHLLPNTTVVKDPTITLDAGSEKAWIAAKVTVIGNVYPLIGIAGTDMININGVASGGLLAKTPASVNNWNGLDFVHETEDCYIYQKADKANNTWTLYIFMKNQTAATSKIVLFEHLNISKDWDNEQMAYLAGMNIKVEAFATQTNGFGDCYTAMTTAFEDAFKFN